MGQSLNDSSFALFNKLDDWVHICVVGKAFLKDGERLRGIQFRLLNHTKRGPNRLDRFRRKSFPFQANRVYPIVAGFAGTHGLGIREDVLGDD